MTAAGLVSACEVAHPHVPEMPALSAPRLVTVRTGGRPAQIPLDDYVLGSIIAEVSPVNDGPAAVERIFQLQAILARTYAAFHIGRHRAEGFDLCDSSHCQLYAPARLRTSRFAVAARAAVQATRGVVLAYGQPPIDALFHADCGGHLAAADAVWGGPRVPYLLSASDSVPSAAHREWTTSVSADDLQRALNADARTRVGRTFSGLEIQKRDASGRAGEVRLDGEARRIVRGEDLRAVINLRLGDKTIQSTRFTIRQAGRAFTFRGTGFGHGVGLCQLGAATRVRRGESVEAILGAYFKGAKLARART
jgi:stage II sporulation protein D